MRALALLTVAAFAAVPALALTQADSAPPAQSTAAKGGDNDDTRVRCRRVEVTGSLVKRGRICRTVREWRESSDANSENARKMIDESRARQGG